mmetsp:Transcript_31/g.45  ORF Transcript_31/g.45 Transcript_31/m.45 type:complete len:94 (+) Transcript_31:40-321(+)
MASVPKVPKMNTFEARLRSFDEEWPHGSSHYATPTLLALSGFFHAPGRGHRDRCICYQCGVTLWHTSIRSNETWINTVTVIIAGCPCRLGRGR